MAFVIGMKKYYQSFWVSPTVRVRQPLQPAMGHSMQDLSSSVWSPISAHFHFKTPWRQQY
ncbi:hypothetical protein I7I50_12080 [Histoplasma capsulatum G186AR]|uniref:Uncharacterized protein n=1 Tax=Ajellomyces capsulatus TaxID=5037 RepID=A0A8H7Y8M3_AJECA|nr:hypothetical protein I7I52_11608 [Histoplasma capsulatum]QSS70446.1 hypothetical protein I7I50_12080 [Histoplasma capsulatum G186AR]